MSGVDGAQERAAALTAAKIEAEVNGPAGASWEAIDRLRMSGFERAQERAQKLLLAKVDAEAA
ncbi:MAG: hypothetical protein NT128_07120, partial [Proteobacteria bacterium]|nr:hypothetical protein [Pseudomonadota bacterium]